MDSSTHEALLECGDWRVHARYLLWVLTGFLVMAMAYYPLALFQVGVPTPKYQRDKSVFEAKQAYALKHADEPRIFFVGGSSAFLGISAAMVEKVTGVRAINLGVNACYCPELVTYKAQQLAKPGDTIVMAYEYESYDDSFWDNGRMLSYASSHEPEFFSTLDFKTKVKALYGLPPNQVFVGISRRLGSGLGLFTPPEDLYVRRMNDNGDYMANDPEKQTLGQKKQVARAVPIYDGGVRLNNMRAYLKKLKNWSREHHVQILATYPNQRGTPAVNGKDAQAEFAAIEACYQTAGVPTLGRPRDFIFWDQSWFWDGSHHLNKRATQPRTAKLISFLMPYLKTARTRH